MAMTFSVTILGCGSATPSLKHFTSAQIVNVRDKLFLVDCGDGTQIQLRGCRLPFGGINNIFISHLHGDHCFGLMGVISSFGLLGRTAPLFVYAPKEFEHIFKEMLDFFCTDFPFEVVFKGFDSKKQEVIYDDRSVSVTTVPLKHRVPCAGFLFKEKPVEDHIDRAACDYYKVPQWDFARIKQGGDFTLDDGTVIPHERLTKPAEKPRSYAYCCDTAYNPAMIEQISGVDAVYHDCTYSSADELKANQYYHSTTVQAATIAGKANAGKLILGHFSAKYQDENQLLDEALKVFPNTVLAKEKNTIDL
ncbi:MAG: ribonuclease Z [Bacteroidaceae bacterium]|nr:ribonuclease Z [Bacteroidaceae bacterium]